MDGETKRILDEFIEREVQGIPDQEAFEKVRHEILRDAVTFALRVNVEEFLKYMCGDWGVTRASFPYFFLWDRSHKFCGKEFLGVLEGNRRF